MFGLLQSSYVIETFISYYIHVNWFVIYWDMPLIDLVGFFLWTEYFMNLNPLHVFPYLFVNPILSSCEACDFNLYKWGKWENVCNEFSYSRLKTGEFWGFTAHKMNSGVQVASKRHCLECNYVVWAFKRENCSTILDWGLLEMTTIDTNTYNFIIPGDATLWGDYCETFDSLKELVGLIICCQFGYDRSRIFQLEYLQQCRALLHSLRSCAEVPSKHS